MRYIKYTLLLLLIVGSAYAVDNCAAAERMKQEREARIKDAFKGEIIVRKNGRVYWYNPKTGVYREVR